MFTNSNLVRWSTGTGNRALVCVPWAGAGAAPFRSWAPVDDTVSVYGIRLAGRESRVMEAVPDDLTSMVDEVVEAVKTLDHEWIALFGHCSGALVAYEASHVLGDLVSALYVASQLPPAVVAAAHVADAVDPSTLGSYLAPELRDDPLLADHFLSLLVSDCNAIGNYEYANRGPLSVPITVLRGSHDAECSAEAVAGWQVESRLPLTIAEIHDADHLFSGESWSMLGQAIMSSLVQPTHADRK